VAETAITNFRHDRPRLFVQKQQPKAEAQDEVQDFLDSFGFLQNSAEGDPFPIFLKFFKIMKSKRGAWSPVKDTGSSTRAGSLVPIFLLKI